MICLIPARSGSKRLPRKNLRTLAGRPLVIHAITNAYDSEVFDEVYLSTESAEIAEVAVSWTGCKHIKRPDWMAEDDSPDIDWVKHALGTVAYLNAKKPHDPECSLMSGQTTMCSCQAADPEFAILRPTSPFLGPEAIQRAKSLWDDIKGPSGGREGYCFKCAPLAVGKLPSGRCSCLKGYDSARAIRPASEPAWKQWRYDCETHEIDPITSVAARKHLHSRPTQTLEDCWIQTAGLEMAWSRTPLKLNTIAGERIAGFPLEFPESLDLNTHADWATAEAYALKNVSSAS